jgi:catechol 2,3-dioxygenase-like lactoylglutathione lyase family enzyme
MRLVYERHVPQTLIKPLSSGGRVGHHHDDDARRIAMALTDARIEARLPAQDLDRARRWYADKLGLEPVEERDGGLRYEGAAGVFCLFASAGAAEGAFTQLAFSVDDIETEVADLRRRGVVFEEFDMPGMRKVDGITDVAGNYPSKGTRERAVWFRDSEGNMLGMGQSLP